MNKTNFKAAIRITVILCILSLIATPLYAAQSVTFDLEKIKELTLEHNRTLKKLEIATDSALTSKKMAEDTYKNKSATNTWKNLLEQLKNLESKIAADPANTNLIKHKAVLEAQIAAAKSTMGTSQNESIKDAYREAQDANQDAKTAKNENEEVILYQVEKLYTSILTTDAQRRFLVKTGQINNQMLKIERLKNELGLSSQSDVDKAAVNAKTMNNSINSINDSIRALKWNMNDMVGRDLTLALNLVNFDFAEIQIPTYNELLSSALSNSSAIAQKERDIKQAKDDLDDDDIKDDGNKTDLKENEIKGLEVDLENAKASIQAKVKAMLEDITNKKNAYDVAKVDYDNKKKTYDYDLTKYELGLISKIQLDGSELALVEAESKLLKAKYDFYHAQRALELLEKGIQV